jgi:4-hydroxy-2-oxoheptanedioate aldolase
MSDQFMYKSKIYSKLRQGKIARLANLNQLVTYFPHHAAKFQYDGVWLDAEHNTWNPREIQYLLAIHRLAGIDCIVRPPTREKTRLYQLLENGATGLMLPHVSSASEAAEIVSSVKFPPIGQRGLGGAGLDQNFKVAASEDYPVNANRETLLIVQIETPEGLSVVDDIARVNGVDALFLGAEDLSLRIGCPNDCREPELQEAQREIDLACKRNSKVWGRPCRDQDDIVDAAKAGARIIAHGSLFKAVVDHLKESASAFDDAENSIATANGG